jgi:hypothetical protein
VDHYCRVNRHAAVLLLAVVSVGPLLARAPGFGEFRAVQESLKTVHPRVGGQAGGCGLTS